MRSDKVAGGIVRCVVRSVAIVLWGVALCVMSGTASEAQTKIRIGAQPSLGMLPIQYGIEKEIFKAEGLDVVIVTLQPGPPTIAALMAGEIEAGWVASIAAILARANKVPVKLFANIVQEQLPNDPSQWLMATKASGITTTADLRGKTVMINANGGACELSVREHLATVNLSLSDVKRVTVPFPQMQAALELGSADAACVIDIFYENMRRSDKIRETPVTVGLLPTTTRPMFANGLVATDAWLTKNKLTVAKFTEAYNKSLAMLSHDKNAQLRLATTYAGVSSALASQIRLIMYRPEATVVAESLQPYIDAMVKTGMLKQTIPADEMIAK